MLFTQIEHTTALSQANSIHIWTQVAISSQNGISNSDAYFTCKTYNWYTTFVHDKLQVYYYVRKSRVIHNFFTFPYVCLYSQSWSVIYYAAINYGPSLFLQQYPLDLLTFPVCFIHLKISFSGSNKVMSAGIFVLPYLTYIYDLCSTCRFNIIVGHSEHYMMITWHYTSAFIECVEIAPSS